MLFNLFINVLELGLGWKVAEFADDTTLFRLGKSQAEELPMDHSTVVSRLQKGIKFKVSKCKVRHTGPTNPNFTSTVIGCNMEVTDQQTNLGLWQVGQ